MQFILAVFLFVVVAGYIEEAIYDLQDTPHLIARNGSSIEPLRFIMAFVVRKSEPTILPLSLPEAARRY